MQNNYFLSIDCGTSSIKAALLNDNAEIIDIESVSTNLIMPQPNFCEMDMQETWQKVLHVIFAVQKRNPKAWQNIKKIGVCAQGDGAWMLDKNKLPVKNAILWNDTRYSKNLDDINDFCLKLDTTALFPGASICILKWLKENAIEDYNNVQHVLHCKDWINYNLTGIIATDETDASTQLLNIFTKQYEFSILDEFGIGEKQSAFPKVLNSNDVLGCVTQEIADLLSLSNDTQVIVGAIDILAVATGCALINENQSGTIIGTTLGNFVICSEDVARKQRFRTGSVLCHTTKNGYLMQKSALSGTPILDWVRKNVTDNMEFKEMELLAAQIEIGSEGVIFLPYIFGERAPFCSPNATGAFFGIKAHHNKSHLVRASYEALAFSIYDCFRELPDNNDTLYIAGGGAKSNFLCQMVADMLGKNVFVTDSKELGILGVYYMLNSKGYDVLQESKKIFIPNLENHTAYKSHFENFYKLRKNMQLIWN